MRFGFLLKRGKPEARELATELAQVLAARGCTLFALADDVAAVPGARGRVRTTAWAPRSTRSWCWAATAPSSMAPALVADHGVPIFGVNLGSLGFITHYARSEAAAAIEEAAGGRLQHRGAHPAGGDDPRRRRGSRGCRVRARSAVNDAVLTQRSIARLLDLKARLDGAEIATYKADGLIVVDANRLDRLHARGRAGPS